MASKGQKHKSYPPELKAAILKENEAGYGWKAFILQKIPRKSGE